ncbi:MAG: hypothetical protein ACREUY_06165 [Burkholderiales bacterium]
MRIDSPASVPTLTQGYLYIPQHNSGAIAGSNPGTNNRVHLYAFDVPNNLTIAKIIINCSAGTGAQITVGIYSRDGNTLLGSATVASSVANVNTLTPSSPIALTPGSYWLAIAAATWSVSVQTMQVVAVQEALLNGYNKRFAYATNAMSAGSLPSATGTINAQGGAVNFPIVKLETA